MLSNTKIFDFKNTFSSLGNSFYTEIAPTQVESPSIVKFNYDLADELGLKIKNINTNILANFFSGNHIAKDSKPLAMVYAGHQFGHFVPQLGDGRAILLGEIIDKSSSRRDIQLKGSGITPYSRQGDGRAALGPVIREYIISEAMNSLGISTTRSLSIVSTGEPVYREKILPGAILTRVAYGHIRTGTFQYFAARGNFKAVKTLFDYTIKRHFPEILKSKNPYISFLEKVMDKYAELVAKWMQVGFIHGVMNTDNMAITCETIDYGPCAFMDNFEKTKVFSSIDQFGRYSYGNQPSIAQWNLARLAETLIPLIDTSSNTAIKLATNVVESFTERFKNYWLNGMRRKIGLFNEEFEDDYLIESLLEIMHENKTDFTITFRRLSNAVLNKEKENQLKKLFYNSINFENWFLKWQNRLSLEGKKQKEIINLMKSVNPSVIPRNHLVEKAISAAELNGDYSFLENLLKALANPFDEKDENDRYVTSPKPEEVVLKTFCGT
tara:strand:+ start:732 stop:2219 length:1488 start_codon:yes stop_codon:yes gene_type:complete